MTENNMETLINQITLDCLLNRAQYEKYVQKNITESVKNRDRKFYRKRIVNLTKELLSNIAEVPPDIQYAFENFIKLCINYFKVIDTSDILQEEYRDQDTSINEPHHNHVHDDNIIDTNDTNDDINDINDKPSYDHTFSVNENNVQDDEKIALKNNIDSLLIRTVKINTGLEKFVTRKIIKQPEESMIIPLQKDINLRDPKLKKKGIAEKKNIHINYDEQHHQKEEKNDNKLGKEKKKKNSKQDTNTLLCEETQNIQTEMQP